MAYSSPEPTYDAPDDGRGASFTKEPIAALQVIADEGAVPGDGESAWGAITGTLADQTDLQTALNAKGNLAGGNTWAGLQTITPAVGGSALVVTGVAQTTSRPVLDLAQTWCAAASPHS
jgi:hypothetical protein